jgi:hypothetical protein
MHGARQLIHFSSINGEPPRKVNGQKECTEEEKK